MIKTVVFDLGGVLIDWNPRYLYRKIYQNEEEMEWFLANICTPDWNEQQDAGRSFEEATLELLARHPEHEEAIRAWYGRWKETIRGPLSGTVDILQSIRDAQQHRLYALTNWSAETFPWAMEKFEFLQWFEGIVVSGVEKTRKPYPEFYQILLDRYKIHAPEAVFIDDNLRNIEAARAIGMQGIHFTDATQLRASLASMGIQC